MAATQGKNTYLEQVVAEQAQLEEELRPKAGAAPQPARSRRRSAAAAPAAPGAAAYAGTPAPPAPAASDEPAASHAVDVRITGVGRWKTVLVPPNAFVVHTRRGRAKPLHVGLGVSFRYNPATDSFLVVPGAMQTIVISAYCICRELQGVVVQAYVQWLIDDFAVAYQRLDFGDAADPMRLVNLQLKEQAEAAIKDKVATMGVHEVLSDKQPIIEELTARLRAVAEGEGEGHQGLGLRIVTVQIKEAVVSSARLWENLQKPYRAEQSRVARLAELTAETAISEQERNAGREGEVQRLENERELAELRARNEALAFDREATEQVRRAQREQQDARRLAELRHETFLHALELERSRNDQETEVGRLRIAREQEMERLTLDGEMALARSRAESAHERALLDLERERLHAAIENEQTPNSIQAKLVTSLPDIVEKLPKPAELTAVTIGGNDATTVSGLLAELTAVVGALRKSLSRPNGSG